MYRIISYKYTEAISHAFSLLPWSIFRLLEYTHFLTGIDPIYAGLHSYIDTNDNRSYRDTAHVAYPWNHLNGKERTTIVLPTLKAAYPSTVIHELGHCLDEIMGFRHEAKPVNDYAQTDRREAFAEAFTAQYFWLGKKAEDIFQSDIETQLLFKELARN